MKKCKTVFFDLFFTLILPVYHLERNENDIIGVSVEEWEKFAEDEHLYFERAIGNELDPDKIISKITDLMPYKISEAQKQDILHLRKERMRSALINIDSVILETIKLLRENGIKSCLISNADVIDSMYWNESPLANYFDSVLFSCFTRSLKPDKEIYLAALEKMNCNPEECIFVGDGGSEELKGAKNVGIRTVFTEYLDLKTEERRKQILKYADHHIIDFRELIYIVNK